MRRDASSPSSEKTKGKQYPIKHKRPKGQIIERGPKRFMVWLHSHTDYGGYEQGEAGKEPPTAGVLVLGNGATF